jgi:hypothetical protein
MDPDIMTDSSSQSDDTSYGSTIKNSRRKQQASNNLTSVSPTPGSARRRKGVLNAKERNLRRLESNERERMRMHSLNDAFQVIKLNFFLKKLKIINLRKTSKNRESFIDLQTLLKTFRDL